MVDDNPGDRGKRVDLKKTVSTAMSSKPTSSYLSRLARSAGGGVAGGGRSWISSTPGSSIDHSSPAANLQSRLKRMEADTYPRSAIEKQAPYVPPSSSHGHVPAILQNIPQQIPSQQSACGAGGGNAAALRARIQNAIAELQAIDRDLANL